MLKDRKIYCLQARPCIFQAGNYTGRGSEGVNFYDEIIILNLELNKKQNKLSALL